MLDGVELCISLIFSDTYTSVPSTKVGEETVFAILFALLDDAFIVSNSLRNVDSTLFSADDNYLFSLFDTLLNYILQKSNLKKVHVRVYDWIIQKSIPEYLIQKVHLFF